MLSFELYCYESTQIDITHESQSTSGINLDLTYYCKDKDTDNDGIPDALDVDSDNDGISDLAENGHENLDANFDGKIDLLTDTNLNGQEDSLEGMPLTDSDNDTVPNIYDLDSDNDGIFDVYENNWSTNLDADFDGDIDSFVDNNNNGWHDNSEQIALDSDGDNLYNAIDTNSDGDNCSDTSEAGFTENTTGTLDGTGFLADGRVNNNTDGYTNPNNNYQIDDTITFDDLNNFSICTGMSGSIQITSSDAIFT